MARAGDRSLRDCLVWAFIIGGHALLILVFMGNKQRQVPQVSADAPSPGVLILLDLPSQASDSQPVIETPQLASVPVVTLPQPEIDTESTAITLPPETENAPGTNAIDWQREAERSAQSTVERNGKSREKRIGEHPPSPFAEKKKKPKEFGWDPNPERVGLTPSLIPYVRIGQRCVVGLGFFGCSLSKLPEPNSHLFDGMHDADRERSSVPEIDTSSALDPPPD